MTPARWTIVISLLAAALPAAAQTPPNTAPPNTAPPTAPAPQAQLPETVITATAVPTLIQQIPAGVTVITARQLEQEGATTLVDALSLVPGLAVVQSGGPGGVASVFIRGTDSDNVLVLRDGVAVNDPSDPNSAFNFGVDTLADIDRIEIVRGPMSSLYGTGAIGGVINIITKPGSGPAHGTVTLAAGLPAAAQAAATLSGSLGAWDYRLGAQAVDTTFGDTVPKRETVYDGQREFFRTDTGGLELGYTPIDGTRLFLGLDARTSAFSMKEHGYPTYDSQDYRGYDDAWTGRLGATTTLFGFWDSALTLARLQTDRHYLEPLEAADPNEASGDSRYHGARDDLTWNNTIHLPAAGPLSGSALLFGYEHRLDTSNSRLDLVTAGVPYLSAVRASATSDAAHTGLQTTLWHRLTVTADLRGEDARYGGEAATWRTGAVLALPELLSRLHAAYGTAFRAPSLYDLFGQDSYGYVGNPLLKPERSRGYELGWAIDVPLAHRPRFASLDVTYFQNDIDDLIQTVYNATYTASTQENVARALTRGIEMTLSLRPAGWLTTDLTYTYTDARNLATHTALLRRPKNRGTIDARIEPIPGLVIVPQVVLTSAFDDYLEDDNGIPIGTGLSPGGAYANLSASYRLRPGLTLFADGRNIFNARFEPANGYTMPGASLLLGVRAGF